MAALREARIDLGAISRNVETVRRDVGGVDVMVVVKANGYGHGAVESSRAAIEGGAVALDGSPCAPPASTRP
jgi:alanine racemase